jgi:hypothetical protein
VLLQELLDLRELIVRIVQGFLGLVRRLMQDLKDLEVLIIPLDQERVGAVD